MRFKAAQRSIGCPTAHIEERRGSRDQAREYCRKLDTAAGPFIEYGEWRDVGQGARNDLQEVARLVADGASLAQLAGSHPVQVIKFGKGIASLIQLNAPKRRDRTELYLHIGVSGAGKSFSANNEWRAEHPDWSIYWFNWQNGWWWDGYHGEQVVIIDNVPPAKNNGGKPFMSYDALCRLADEYDLQVPVKGSMANFAAKRIYITSTANYASWWPDRSDYKELERRLTKIRRYSRPYFRGTGRTSPLEVEYAGLGGDKHNPVRLTKPIQYQAARNLSTIPETDSDESDADSLTGSQTSEYTENKKRALRGGAGARDANIGNAQGLVELPRSPSGAHRTPQSQTSGPITDDEQPRVRKSDVQAAKRHQ